jgi:N utilization substance protein A
LARIIFDSKIMGYISIFENLTGTKVKDCIPVEGLVTFIVQPNEIAKAIGKGGGNARRIEGVLKRKIKIVEFDPELTKFIRNLVYPLEVGEIVPGDNGIVTVRGRDTTTKSMLIGRNAGNLRATEAIVKRYFDIAEIKVV